MDNIILSVFDFLASNLFLTLFICFGIAIVWIVVLSLCRCSKNRENIEIDLGDE